MQQKCEGQERKPGHTYRQWALTVLANTTVLIYGLDVGWISPMAKILQSDQSPAGEPLSDILLSWTASIMCLASVFSVALYTYIANRFGSRISVVAIAVPQAISWIMRLCSSSAPSLVIARILSGIAAGGCYNTVIIYVKESSQESIRGILSSMVVLFQNSGIFIMFIMGIYLDYYTIIWIVSCVPIVTGVLLCRAPDSPVFLIKRGKVEEATATLAKLRGLNKDDKTITNEITWMKNENDNSKSMPNMSLVNIVKNPIWRREIFVLVVAVTVRSFNGAFVIMTYTSIILTSTGVEFSVSAEILSLTIPAVLIIGSIMATLSMERIDRKDLNIIMLLITACSMLGIAVPMLIKDQGGVVPSWLPVLSTMVSVWAYAGGVASIPFVVAAEMFSFQIRAKVLGIVATMAWLTAFFPIVAYVPLSNVIGLHTTFFIFAGVNVFGAVFTLVFWPETRGKTVAEIEKNVALRIGLNKDLNVT